jgi:predicted MFS family arabinose efflux permease
MSSPPPVTPSPVFRITLIGLVSLAVAVGIGRFAFTPLLPMMRADGLVNIAEGGLLASGHFLGYLLGALTVAKIPCPPRALLRGALLAIGIGTVWMGLTGDFTLWLILRALNGVFSAWVLVLVSSYYVSRLAGIGRPEFQGWVFSGVGAGIAIAGLACLVFMVGGTGSALSWQITGFASLGVIAIVCLSIGAEVPSDRPLPQDRTAHRSPPDWGIVAAYGAMGAGYIIPATYLPVMAREIVPDPLIFGWSWPVFGAAAFVSTIYAATLQKRYTNRQVWAVCQAIMAAGLILPVLYPHIATIIAAGLCVGGTFMIITMTGMKEAHRIAPPDEVMRHIAIMTASFAAGQVIGPVFASTVYDVTQSFALPLVIASAVLVVTILPLLRPGRAHA